MRTLVLVALALGLVPAAPAQPDTLAVPVSEPVLPDPAPVMRPPAGGPTSGGPTAGEVAGVDTSQTRSARVAVTRALIAPGLGQLYNRQPVKAPIAAALVVGAVFYAVDRQRQYVRFRRATVFAGCQSSPGVVVDEDGVETVTSPERAMFCTETAPGYQDEWEALGAPTFAAIRPVRDRARGQRDVGVLVVAVAYAFQALDAYVFAKLSDFDVSEDVTLRLDPGPGPATLTLRVGL